MENIDNLKVGDDVVYRASALTPLDPCCFWHGVIRSIDAGGYALVDWTRTVDEAPREIQRCDPLDILARPRSAIATDRHAYR